MRSPRIILSCGLCLIALMVCGCADQKAQIATLEEENAALCAERDDLSLQLVSAQERLDESAERTELAEAECVHLKETVADHIKEIAKAKAQEEITQQALARARQEMTAANQVHSKTAAEQQMRAKKAERAAETARQRLAELERQLEELKKKLAETAEELEDARAVAEEAQ